MAQALRAAGAHVEVHDDHFPSDALDETWLGVVGERGWVVLTKDRRIRYRTTALSVMRAAGVRVFVLTAGDLQGWEMANVFVRALARMRRFVARNPAPFVAKVTRGASLVSARERR